MSVFTRMNRKLLLTIIPLLLAAALASINAQNAAAQSGSKPEEDRGLCLPAAYLPADPDCLLAGPAKRLTDLAAQGITFPETPLPIAHPAYDLLQIPFTYARLTNDPVPVYATLDTAEQGNQSGVIDQSLIKYVSLSDKAVTDQGTFYQIATGEWINAETASKVSIPYFQGYLIKGNLPVSFAIVLTKATSRTAPGYSSPETGKTYERTAVLHVYDSQVVDDMEWDRIGPDEWIEHRFVGRIIPAKSAPEGVTGGRWIEVNLYEQTLIVYEDSRPIFATLITSGSKPFYTQPGLFKIYKKLENDVMRGAFEADKSDFYYLENVPYIMYYDQARALHGAYWNPTFGYPGSHGCVNLAVGDAHWLYDWAQVGEQVYVWDPSGKTPTDSSLYGAGGF